MTRRDGFDPHKVCAIQGDFAFNASSLAPPAYGTARRCARSSPRSIPPLRRFAIRPSFRVARTAEARCSSTSAVAAGWSKSICGPTSTAYELGLRKARQNGFSFWTSDQDLTRPVSCDGRWSASQMPSLRRVLCGPTCMTRRFLAGWRIEEHPSGRMRVTRFARYFWLPRSSRVLKNEGSALDFLVC
jgi:hypothetical protein